MERHYACHICASVFTKGSNLKRHMRMHTGERPFICHWCEKSYTDQSTLRRHVKQHVCLKSSKLPCHTDIFGKSFGEQPRELSIESKLYNCDVCKKTFSSKTTVRAHLKIHTGEKPYTCEVCSKSFTKSYNFKNHRRIHTGEKPYMCDVCGERCSTKDRLNKHVRTHSKKR